MPYINIALTSPLEDERAGHIASRVSAHTAQHLRKDQTITSISLTRIDPNHWFIGGRSLAAHKQSTFWLDIKVVDGTNLKTELATYADAIFKAMGDVLGDVHSESYVLIHEVPASAYGFGGRTQEHRFIAAQMKAAQ